MDMRMPVMDGYEATRAIKAREQERWRDEESKVQSHPSPITDSQFPIPKTAIIALTASAFQDERQTILSAGCDDFVAKPFREEVLLEKVSKHLGVAYVYEEPASETEGQTQHAQDILTSPDLKHYFSQMPTQWVEQLYNAAATCSDELVLELIAQIPQENALLIQVLTNLVKNFQFQ
jgi:two-component system sensor histidine kinase/response regulator